jgi:predicted DCC family thiol-disulfide oxidoreductase YuxK
MTGSQQIIVFDSDCILCNRWVAFVLRHDPAGIFQFAALNSEAVRTRIPNPAQRDGSTLLLLTPEGVLTHSTAVLKIASQLPGYQPLARLLLKIPRVLRDRAYSFVARHRHALQPGRNIACTYDPQVMDRFLS